MKSGKVLSKSQRLPLCYFTNDNDSSKGKIQSQRLPSQVEANFRDYINSYSSNIDEIIDKFDYRQVVTQIVKAKRLASIIELAANEDFSPANLFYQ